MSHSAMPSASGVIHDIGYRHYDGPRGGRKQIWRALYVHSLRGVFGLGRAARTKITPFTLLAMMLLPALIIVAVMAFSGATETIVDYTTYAIIVWAVPAIFLASQAPQTVSRDLRFHTLPLYFSRPLTDRDYVSAKFAGMTTALFGLFAAPLLLLYVGALLVKLPFLEQTGEFLASLASVAILSAMLSALGLLIASMTPRRGLGVAAVMTFLMGTYGVVSAVQGITYELGEKSLAGWAGLFSPITLYDGLQVAFGAESNTPAPPPGTAAEWVFVAGTLAFTALCYWLLSLRYKKVGHS